MPQKCAPMIPAWASFAPIMRTAPVSAWRNRGRKRAVLEVRSPDVPFVEQGQTVCSWFMTYVRPAKSALRDSGIRLNYQSQGLKLAKHFADIAACPGGSFT